MAKEKAKSQVTWRPPGDIKERLEKFAEQKDLSENRIITEAVKEFLEKREAKPKKNLF